MARDGSPNFAIPHIVILDGHTVAPKISEALDPRILKGRDGLVQQGHHGVGHVDEGEHVVQAGRQAVSQELEEAMDTMAPHAGGHGVFGGQSSQCWACLGMFGGKEEVVMLMQQGAVEGNQGLPLIVVQLVGWVGLRSRNMVVVDLDAFALDHNQAGVDTLDLGDELLLGDWLRLGLLHDLRCLIFNRNLGGRMGRGLEVGLAR